MFVSLQCHWMLRGVGEQSDEEEEELYYKNKTAVWSRGLFFGSWRLVKSFTVDSTIKQVLWCTFKDSNKPSIISTNTYNTSTTTRNGNLMFIHFC